MSGIPDLASLIEAAIQGSERQVITPSNYGSPELAQQTAERWAREYANARPYCEADMYACYDSPRGEGRGWMRG